MLQVFVRGRMTARCGRVSIFSLPLLLSCFFAVSNVQAELTCEGFHALSDFVQANHAERFDDLSYARFYVQGLIHAVETLQQQTIPIDEPSKQKLLKYATEPNLITTCQDSLRILQEFHRLGFNHIRLSHVLGLITQGMVRSYDPHSEFFLEDDWQAEITRTTSAKLGFSTEKVGNSLSISAVYPFGPAEGILEIGDELVSLTWSEASDVNFKQHLSGESLSENFSKIYFENNTPVTLRFRRNNAFMIAVVNASTDEGSRVVATESLPDGVGYLRVSDFNSPTVADDIAQAISQLQRTGNNQLVLDLRDNPGGRLDQAIQVLDMLVGDGVAMLLKDQSGNVKKYYLKAASLITTMKTVTLVNRNTASAAEFLPGALLDYERAIPIGEKTFGKGSAQRIYPPTFLAVLVHESLRGNGLRLTEYRFYTPSGRSNQQSSVHIIHQVEDRQAKAKEQRARMQALQHGVPFVAREADHSNALVAARLNVLFGDAMQPLGSLKSIYPYIVNASINYQQRFMDYDRVTREAAAILSAYESSCSTYKYKDCFFFADPIFEPKPESL